MVYLKNSIFLRYTYKKPQYCTILLSFLDEFKIFQRKCNEGIYLFQKQIKNVNCFSKEQLLDCKPPPSWLQFSASSKGVALLLFFRRFYINPYISLPCIRVSDQIYLWLQSQLHFEVRIPQLQYFLFYMPSAMESFHLRP